MLNGGWDDPAVAEAQRDFVLGELQDAEHVQPYLAFAWAMSETGIMTGSLLDVGCGCGHYGVLCERHYPRIDYIGTDVSQAMIEQARELAPLGRFRVCGFMENGFGCFDIVLVSQVIEFTTDRWASLEYLLRQANGYVVLNRIRLTPETSHEIDEVTYAGHMGKEWLWNYQELVTKVSQFGVIVGKYDWDNQCCLLVKCHV